MNVDNVKSQMRKGMLEYCILLLLHRESAYSSDIIQKLKEARLIVVEGTLYPLLTRLKNDGLVVRVGGVHARTATQVLWTDSGRGGISERTGKCLGRTFRHGESFKTKHLKIT